MVGPVFLAVVIVDYVELVSKILSDGIHYFGLSEQ
jgi:hypothetical protein